MRSGAPCRRTWAKPAAAVLIVAAAAVASAAAAHPDSPDDPRRSVTADPAELLSDGQVVLVTNRGFGVNMAGVRVEQCTADLTTCDPADVVLATTGRNGRFGPHDNPVNVDAPEVVAVPFTVKARFDAGGRTVDCVPTACVIQAGGGTDFARHAHIGFGAPLPPALRPVPPRAQGAAAPPGGAATGPAGELPGAGDGALPPVNEGPAATTEAPPPSAGDGVAAAGAVPTTRRSLELLPASTERAWSILPVVIVVAVLGALLLLLLAGRRRTPVARRTRRTMKG